MAKGESRKKVTSPDAEHVTGLPSNQARVDAAEGVQGREDYEAQLHLLQIELAKLQRHSIGCGDCIFVLLEGRDTTGKDGSIRRIIEFFSLREARVVALGKPSDHERTGWYLQRYVPHFPSVEEFVLFNRSWCNRAGAESVMGFCTTEQYDGFMYSVPHLEGILVDFGIKPPKYYLDISKVEQARRPTERYHDPSRQWETSPADAVASKHQDAYTTAHNVILMHTHTATAPRHIVLADDERMARLNLIRHILSRLYYADKKSKLVAPDPEVAFKFPKEYPDTKRLVF